MKALPYILGCVSLAAVTPLRATSVLLDFGNNDSFRGLSVSSPDANGNHWNSVSPGAYFPNLTDTTGTATTIDFGPVSGLATDSYNGPAGATNTLTLGTDILNTDIDNAALGNLGTDEGAFDFIVGQSGAGRFEIQGLDPTKSYKLTFFGSHKYNTDNTTVYSVYSDNTYTSQVATTSLVVGVDNLHNRDSVAVIDNLSPQQSNILYIQFGGSNGNDGYLNAMEITVIPEPAAALLASVGLIGMLRRRRNH
jgi:hypothetical protein